MGFILFRSKNYWGDKIESMPSLYSYCNDRYKDFVFNEDKCK
jgi:hypothetical protein